MANFKCYETIFRSVEEILQINLPVNRAPKRISKSKSGELQNHRVQRRCNKRTKIMPFLSNSISPCLVVWSCGKLYNLVWLADFQWEASRLQVLDLYLCQVHIWRGPLNLQELQFSDVAQM